MNYVMPMTDSRLAALIAAVEAGQESYTFGGAYLQTVVSRELAARIMVMQTALERIAKWERYGGQDSKPLVYPTTIAKEALALFADNDPGGE